MDALNQNEKCLISTLSFLRESSKEAVASADFSDPYTLYMHVNRPVQDEFLSVLRNTYNSDHAELVLLCGSVGDGKSHMLSYCHEVYPDMMNSFSVHNDSTASLYVDKPASYTLTEIMSPFSDDNIETSKQKLILAINLGTLSNFLNSDKENRFSLLKEYVWNAGILDENKGLLGKSKHFHSINFADYHLYEITANGAKSSYIKGILNKITSADEHNVFYANYMQCCKKCDAFSKCPIRANYELLMDDKIQDGLIDSLIESIVKNKLIVSTRSLLNLVYEILVDERSFNCGSLEPRKEPEKLSSKEYCEALLPNMLFGRGDSSDILRALGTVDPMRIRNEKVDDFFMSFENTDNIIEVFNNYAGEYQSLLNRIDSIDMADPDTHQLRESILRLLIRLCRLSGEQKHLLSDDEEYITYMKSLYSWNTGHHKDIKSLYTDVGRSVLLWNGKANKNEMQLDLVNKKTEYRLVQEIDIKPTYENVKCINDEVLYSFRDELRLKYKYGNGLTADLDVDFALFELLKKVLNGYVPSINDKRVNIKCEEFIKKISRGGSKQNKVYIRDLAYKEPCQFILEFDEDFGYSFGVD